MTKQQASKANNARSNGFRGMAGLPGIFGVLRTSSQDGERRASVNHAMCGPAGFTKRQNQRRHSGRITLEQASRSVCTSSVNAFGFSLSMSIVPTTLWLVPSKIGTMISDLVVPKAVRYRGSAATSPTFTVRPEKMAAPVSPLLIGNVGYSGALGPLQTIFFTTPAAWSTS